MITPAQAVVAAKQAFASLDPNDQPSDLRLEEISHEETGKRNAWAVTLGFYRPRKLATVPANTGGLLGLGFPMPAQVTEHRVYKTIYIDDTSGEFIRMDIRQL